MDMNLANRPIQQETASTFNCGMEFREGDLPQRGSRAKPAHSWLRRSAAVRGQSHREVRGSGGVAQIFAAGPLGSSFDVGLRWTNGQETVRKLKRPEAREHCRHRRPRKYERWGVGGSHPAARILRDAGRAVVVGERTAGAEAAVLTSVGPDGSVLKYSGWPMVEPAGVPFQEVGIELDHELALTIADVRSLGFEVALERVTRARFAKALEILGRPEHEVEALYGYVGDAVTYKGQASSAGFVVKALFFVEARCHNIDFPLFHGIHFVHSLHFENQRRWVCRACDQ
jgi:hypothetical protein